LEALQHLKTKESASHQNHLHLFFEAPSSVDFPTISMDGPSMLEPSCGLAQRTLRMLGVVRIIDH